MKHNKIELETDITLSYEELLRKAAISLLEYTLPRCNASINGYEDKRYELWEAYGYLIFHLFPNAIF